MSVLLKEAQTGGTISCNVKLVAIKFFLKGITVWIRGNIDHGHI
jgi:hypothetical protein